MSHFNIYDYQKFMRADPSYCTYTYREREIRYDPRLNLEEIRARVRARNGKFFENAEPGERIACHNGHVIVESDSLYPDQPKRVNIYTYDPVTGSVVSVAGIHNCPYKLPDLEAAKRVLDLLIRENL
jgi:hypothetical protein